MQCNDVQAEATKHLNDAVLRMPGAQTESGRTSEAPLPVVAVMLRNVAKGTREMLSRGYAYMGTVVPCTEYYDRMRVMRDAVTVAYPTGLPDNDDVTWLLQSAGNARTAVFDTPIVAADYMDPDTTDLWWAGRIFKCDERVGDRLGLNEKTKIVARLQRRGNAAPARESIVSDAERRAMTEFYFKKQQEAKSLAEDTDDGYLGQAAGWADPHALKANLLGTSKIRWACGR